MVQTIDREPSGGAKGGAAASRGPGSSQAPGAARRAPEVDRGSAAERLIEGSGPLFAEQGFAAVSTRQIAHAAGVNLSAITYHFGGKERLYQALIQRLVDDLAPQRQALISFLEAGLAAAGGERDKLARLAAEFVRLVIGFVLSSALPRWRIQLLLREINQPSAAFALIMRGHIDPLQDALAELVAAATGGAPGDEETRLLTQGVVGQCMLFGLGRAVVLWRLSWDDYTPERIDRVVEVVTPAVLAALGLGLPAGGGGAAGRG